MKTLITIIWIIDVLNIGTNINGFNLQEFLDVSLPINGWAWLLIWVLIPSSKTVFKYEE